MAGYPGMEWGTYTWDSDTGELTVTEIMLDNNGWWGLSDALSDESYVIYLEADDDLLTLSVDENGDGEIADTDEDTEIHYLERQ